LAVRTEDHPLEYESFEGVIPKGEYGAGTMTIWDRGRYTLLEEVAKPGKQKLVVRLHGRRLRGEWHLVETSRGERDWLAFKGRDVYARTPEERPFPFDVDLASARGSGPSRRPSAMRPSARTEPFSDPGWIFELEFEGVRALARKEGDDLRLLVPGTSRRLEGDAESVIEALRGLHAESAILDGVLVATDEDERPSREALERRLAGEGDAPLDYYAFDLIHYDEWQLRGLPLLDRKRLLASLVPPSPRVLFVDHVLGEGERLAATVAKAGLPGVIAKESASRYRGGESKAWRRIEAPGASSRDREKLSRALATTPSEGAGRVRYTNRDKVFWPERGFTKGDMLDYYERVAEHLLPYLHERPIHMQRFPDGIEGKSFYHKNAPDHVPDWVETEPIGTGSKTINYIVCNDRETLLLLANLGSVDLHPWMSRRGSLDSPDWLVLDLDPKSAPFSDVVRVARALGKLLRGIGLRPVLKTSGATGLHVTVPLVSGYTYDQSRMFAEMVALAVVRDHPDLCTVERSVARRRGKVYVDYLQNRRGQTIVPPYVPRPVPAGSVSMPLDWDELAGDLDPARFDLESAPLRLAEVGDLFRPVLTDGQDLGPAIQAFQEHYA
ncbi:MAG: non-homologous end-joining DNA ligase, partial [Planctomycetota bacterium]